MKEAMESLFLKMPPLAAIWIAFDRGNKLEEDAIELE